MTPQIIHKKADLRGLVAEWRKNGEEVAVVPTMGALHAGHLSLVRAACDGADRVIVTIFVNPKQFNNPDDLKKYPRTVESDVQKLEPFRVDAIYAPDPDQIYPDGFSTNVSVQGVSEGLCGAHRPGHFDGVATVVAKLILQTGADRAYFGEKDFQQLQVVRRLVRDLDIPVEIIGCPTVRDPDGMALSSRNALLSAEERSKAAALYRALVEAVTEIGKGVPVDIAISKATGAILAAGYREVEYLELRDEARLQPVADASQPARLLAAAMLGDVRLIDNISVGG